MSEVRCNGCRTWFDSKDSSCPCCAKPRPAFNKWLRTASLNSQLNTSVASADKERRYERAVYGR